MSKDITSQIPFFPLDQLDVRLHTVLSEVLGERVRDKGVGVKTTKLDHQPDPNDESKELTVMKANTKSNLPKSVM